MGWFYGDGISGAWRAEHVTNVRFWETVQYLYSIDEIRSPRSCFKTKGISPHLFFHFKTDRCEFCSEIFSFSSERAWALITAPQLLKFLED